MYVCPYSELLFPLAYITSVKSKIRDVLCNIKCLFILMG